MVDAADVRVQENIDAVDTVLEEIDAHEIPSLMVMNKIDMLDDFEPRIDRDEENKTDSCLAFRADRVDTTAFSGFDGATFRRGGAAYVAFAAAGRASEKPFLSASGNRKEWMEDDGSVSLQVRLPIADWRRLCKQEPTLEDYVV